MRTLGQVTWDFNMPTMDFWRANHVVCWHDIGSRPDVALSNTIAGQDLFAALLDDYTNIFTETRGLPPSRH